MARWYFKWALHRLFAALPDPHRWNALFQTYATRSLQLGPDLLLVRYAHCQQAFDLFDSHRTGPRGDWRALDIGTGWFGFFPLGLFLCGASEVWTFDLHPLMRREYLAQTVRLTLSLAAEGRLAGALPAARADRLARLAEAAPALARQSVAEWLDGLGIRVRIGDVTAAPLAPASFDLSCSYSVLEYLPREPLVALHRALARCSVAGGVAVHLLDFDDEYAKFDRRLSPLDFLRYTEAQWRWRNSALNPIQRLRIDDHRAAFADGGWRMADERNQLAPDAALDELVLAPEFRAYRREDLLVVRSWMTALKAPEPGAS